MRVVSIDFRTDPRWESFVNSHPGALIYHHPSWLIALEQEYGETCLAFACEDEDQKVRAIVALACTKGLPFRVGRSETGARISSLPRTPLAGPLWDDELARCTLMNHVIEFVQSKPGLKLELKSLSCDVSNGVGQLQRVSWRPTYVQEIPTFTQESEWQEFWESIRRARTCGPCHDCRRLRFGNSKKQHRVNWAVNKAVKLGLHVRESINENDLRAWYPLYLKTMRHNAVPPRSYRFFASLWSAMRSEGHLQFLVAEQVSSDDSRLVAGSILLKFGQTVFYAFTGCDPADFCLHPHDIIQLYAIRDACKGGYRWYDFGEVTEDHEELIQFKSKWGSEPKSLYRYYFPANVDDDSRPSAVTLRITRRLWRFLPLKATEVLGDWIYSLG